MSQKKQDTQTLSPEEQNQLQQSLAHYNEVAQVLHSSTQQPEAEAALLSVTNLPESVQIAYLKALSKENTTNAADVVAAFNALAPAKEVRKEAKRSLIRLEGSKTYPQWTPPAPPVVEEEAAPVDTTPPRFWKGLITDTKELGEMQLLLCWEQGPNYKEVRMMGFLLEFWTEGIKDFFTEVNNKRHMEDHIEQMRQQMSGTGVRLTSCSLAQSRRLLQEAQEVNTKTQTKPHRAFTRNLPLIRQFILDAPEAEEEEEVEGAPPAPTRRNIPSIPMMPQDILDTFFPGMANEEVVGDFIDAWSSADYEMAYDLLASDSPLRDGLEREEWVELRQRWQHEAHPDNINVTFIAEYDEDEDFEEDITSAEQPTVEATTAPVDTDEDITEDDDEPDTVETAWSLEFVRTPLLTSIKEIPQASAFYKETNRHWFWVRYSLIEEDGNLRIHDLIDETALASQLDPAEIQQRMEKIALLAGKRLDDLENRLQEDEKDEDDGDEDLDDDYKEEEDDFDVDEEDEDDEEDDDEDMLDTFNRLEEALQIATRYMHYTDALIAQAPTSNATMYRQAYDFARVAQDFERAAVYLQQLAEYFPDQRAKTLQDLTLVQLNIAYNYSQEEEEEEREQQFLKVAEETIRESITLANMPESLTTLAQILVGQNKQLDEAEDLLQQAQRRTTEAHNLALIESNLAKVAELHDDKGLALQHYQHAAEVDPTFPKIWINLGFLQYDLKQYDAAIASLKHSVETNPDDIEGYLGLGEVYRNGLQDYNSAEDILLKGMEVNEESADVLGSLAMVYIDQSNLRKAEKYLDLAEEADPDSDFIEEVREAFELAQSEQRRNKRGPGNQHKRQKPKSKKR
jgi:tetratricopeptide (TPR) repeat protein